jgi:tight adherence protein C
MQYLLWRVARRKHALEKALPNVLDLMVVCVESGLGLDQTVIQVAQELRKPHPELCSEFAVMNLEMRAGKRRVETLHNLADRTGVEDVRRLVAVLVQTDRFGTSIAQSLRRLSARDGSPAGRRTGRQAGREAGLPDFFLRAAVAIRGDHRAGDHAVGARSVPYDRKHVDRR